MKKIKADTDTEWDGFYPEVDKNGILHCSCGAELVKVDEDTYSCGAAGVRYSIRDESIQLDKFGNIMFKSEEHIDNTKEKNN